MLPLSINAPRVLRMPLRAALVAALLLAGCTTREPVPDTDLSIAYVTHRSVEKRPDRVFVYDTGSDETTETDRDSLDVTRTILCGYDPLTVWGNEDAPIRVELTRNKHLLRLAQDYTIGSDTAELTFRIGACHIERNMAVINCTFSVRAATYMTGQVVRGNLRSHQALVVYDLRRDTLIFIDSAGLLPSEPLTRLSHPQFTRDGGYLFYSRDLWDIYSYNLNTGEKAVLPRGEIPIIPWNDTVMLALDVRTDRLLRLDGRGNAVDSLPVTMNQSVYTSYSLGKECYLIGSRLAFGLDIDAQMRVVYYDFARDMVVPLFTDDPGEVVAVTVNQP
jgi:hypothetical protein